MDLIFQCAVTYQNLHKIEYIFKIGRKNELRILKIHFLTQDFYHLLGLQHLTDIERFFNSSEEFFISCLNAENNWQFLYQSPHFNQIQERIKSVPYLEDLMDSDNLVFQYIEKNNPYSHIRADYLISGMHNNQEFYIFLTKEDSDNYFATSFFPKGETSYTLRQPKWKVLYKEKMNLETSESILFFNHIK